MAEALGDQLSERIGQDFRCLSIRASALGAILPQVVARMLRQWLYDDSYMENRLSDFPPHQFAITAHCQCGHSAEVDYRLMRPETRVNSLRPRLICKVCGRRDPGIRIHWAGAGGFKYRAG